MPNVEYIISDEALTDLAEIAVWYEKQKGGLGEEFLYEFYNFSLPKISNSSQAFAKPTYSIRGYSMNRFPYKIYYDSRTVPIKIIAVIHTSRSSHYIKRRLK